MVLREKTNHAKIFGVKSESRKREAFSLNYSSRCVTEKFAAGVMKTFKQIHGIPVTKRCFDRDGLAIEYIPYRLGFLFVTKDDNGIS